MDSQMMLKKNVNNSNLGKLVFGFHGCIFIFSFSNIFHGSTKVVDSICQYLEASSGLRGRVGFVVKLRAGPDILHGNKLM